MGGCSLWEHESYGYVYCPDLDEVNHRLLARQTNLNPRKPHLPYNIASVTGTTFNIPDTDTDAENPPSSPAASLT